MRSATFERNPCRRLQFRLANGPQAQQPVQVKVVVLVGREHCLQERTGVARTYILCGADAVFSVPTMVYEQAPIPAQPARFCPGVPKVRSGSTRPMQPWESSANGR